MSKYGNFEDHIINEDGDNTANTFFLFAIANELAEANRLKRIEIAKFCNVNNYGVPDLEESEE